MKQAPFLNCRFQVCDLPGQCKGEGKCHHPAEGQERQEVRVNFSQIGSAGPFRVIDGYVNVPDVTMQDLVRMLRPTFERQASLPLIPPLPESRPRLSIGEALREAIRVADELDKIVVEQSKDLQNMRRHISRFRENTGFEGDPDTLPSMYDVEGQEPWNGNLSPEMQVALNDIALKCSPKDAKTIEHYVREECRSIYTSYMVTKRMYLAARDKLEAIESAQLQPDSLAPQPAPAAAADAGRVKLPEPDTSETAPWSGWKLKYHSQDQIIGYGNQQFNAGRQFEAERLAAQKGGAA